MWKACLRGPVFRQAWRVPVLRYSTGRFSVLRCPTNRCREPGKPPCSTNCSGWPCDNGHAAARFDSICYRVRKPTPEQPMTSSSERLEASVDPKLLEILVCPLTKGPLEFDSARQELISRSAKLAYPIRDGIPIMLPEEARKID